MSVDRVGSRVVVASVSGGKDSAAMCLHLRELGIEHRRVFADTQWEHESTYDYLRGELTRVLGPIEEVRGPLGMADLVRKKGMFPSRTRRFCTTELKVKPLAAYVRGIDAETVNAVGIRAAESAKRALMPEWEWSEAFDCEVWRPLIHWTEADVIAIHARHGLAPNPLYLRGATRVGCWPCIHSRKSEIRHMAESDPGRVDEIRALESEVLASANARYATRGTTIGELGYQEPTFFQGVTAAPGEKRGMWPIDKAVEWSQTERGGGRRSLELFANHNDGCARWGMCETGNGAADE